MKGQEVSGITLIALVVTIIVLLILAGVSISMLTGQNGILNRVAEAKEKTGIAQSEEKVKLAVMAAIADGNGTLTIENLKKELANNGITIPDNATFPVTVTTGNSTYQIDQYGNITEASTVPQISYTVTNIDGSEITSSNLPGSAKLNVTITNISELTVTSIKIKNSSGTEITGATVDVTKGTISTQITENGKYIVEIVATDKKGKNASASPEIQVSGKLKIANLEANWTAADSTNSNDDWYAYKDNSGTKAQVNVPKLADGMTAIKYSTDSDLTAGSKWANAMTKDGSMWVWIPRYAYKITYTNSSNKSAGGTINIAFLKDATNEFLDNTIQGEIKTNINDVTYTTNGDGTKSQDQWLVAPAFTLGTESIEGFWFAKFEASDNNGSVQIKPNVASWRGMNSASIFTTCLNLISKDKYSTYFNNVSNVDTHMTKNVEWGAVAYLAHSKYGLNGDEIGINTNSSYKTGIGNDGSSAYNTDVGKNSSTTKNVYGIYDMSGGSWEYVAACLTGYTGKLTSDSAYMSKYIDVYDSYSSAKFGDAVFETSSSSSGSNSWFSDYSSFVNSGSPVFRRGGLCSDGSSAGLFYFDYGNGFSNYYYGFRPVCVVK